MMGQNLTDKSFENPLTKLLTQANEQTQKDQKLFSNNNKKEMNPQELFLMQMLKSSSLEKYEEPQLEEELNIANNKESNINDSHDNKFIKLRYEPKFLFELEKSPLVMPPSYWESELPPIEFFRLNKLNNNENRRERRRSSNARRGSTLKKDKTLIDDLKKENNNRNNGVGREDRRTQRARQRENKKRGKFDTSAIEEGDEYSTDTPEWMKEQDKSTGNSMLDFEIWRLKMRIETARRNGEDVKPEDMAEYAKLKSQITSNDINDIERKEEINHEEREVNIAREENIEENSENDAKTTVIEEKIHRSVDDQFELPLLSNITSATGPTSSHFSSFFSADQSVESAKNEPTKRSSRLISIMSDGNPNSNNVKSPLQSEPYLSAQQSKEINNSQQPGLVNSNANGNIQSNIINNTPKQFPVMIPMANSIPNDKNQLFLQSLLSRSMIPPNQSSNPQIPQNMNQQFSQQSMGQRLPNGMDPRMLPGFPTNMNYFPPNMPVPMPIGVNHMQPPQLSAQHSHSQSPLPPQGKNEHRQLGPNRQTLPPSNIHPQQQQQQQQQQNLPYGNNAGNVQGMTPNHPLMMLLNKNKRKSNQDIQNNVTNATNPPSTNNSPLLQQSQPLVNQQTNINNLHFNNSSNIPNMPIMQNNQMVPSEFGKNVNMPVHPPYMNINGMNINGMNINGMNMNGINSMNPQNIQQNANSITPPINRSQTPY